MDTWLWLTISEGCLLGTMKIFHGLVGNLSPTLCHVAFATALVGFLQMAIGFLGARVRNEKVLIHRYNIAGFLVFGLFGFFATLFSFLAFRYGARADMGTNTFIVSILIIAPAALIGRFAFHEDIQWRQCFGGLIAVLGGAILLSPAALAGGFPVWVWWSLVTMLAASGSATTAKTLAYLTKAGKIVRVSTYANIFVLNFWGGVAVSACSLGILLFSVEGRTVLGYAWHHPPWTVGGYALVVAVTNMGWWSCRQVGFQYGAPYFFRMLPWSACFLGTATFGGVLIFHDPLPATKILGLLLFLPAIFVHEAGWRYCSLAPVAKIFHALLSPLHHGLERKV